MFDSWVGPNFYLEGRRYDEQERFFNFIFSNYYLPFIINTISSTDIKENHLTH